jgi:hypothetical protein
MSFKPIGDSIWVKHFPFRLLGAPFGKTTTVIRLENGDLIIHSAAPLASEDVAAVGELGRPRWLMEGSRMHETFAASMRTLFPEATYLLPPRFPLSFDHLAPAEKLRVKGLPESWRGEVEMERIGGVPAVEEHAVWHRSSRTLILSDFVFNMALDPGERVPFFLRWISGIKVFPATSRLVKFATKDKKAVAKSIDRILEWDIDQVVVGHGEIMTVNAKDLLKETLDWVYLS